VVRLLPAVEGLGACTLIASDKTGTLTMNALTVRRILLPDLTELDVSGEGYRPEGEVLHAGRSLDEGVRRDLVRLAECGLMCNEAIYRIHDGEVAHFGDTVDVALQAFAAKLELWREDALRRYPEVALLPFEPVRRYAAAVHRVDGDTVAFVKGAAEVVLPMCADGVDRDGVLAQVERLAGAGYRVIALAAGPVPEGATLVDGALTGLTFLGLTALIDPVRPEVPAAIASCRKAGISVCMVTGDHPATALAIARELDLAFSDAQVMTGAQLQAQPPDVDPIARGMRVFARVEPSQKTDLVRRAQASGHVVAVTGDGVNDAPALHMADIGVAMGRGGTDVARGASDLVITDDNFASIVNGIEEGRIAYANVRKVVFLLISTGIGEIVLFLLSILAGLPIPLFPVQLLWLNLVSNGIQDVALAFERGERDILNRPPRSPRERIFNRRMIEQTALSGAVIGTMAFAAFYWCLGLGFTEFEARNILLLLMISFENVHVFNARSETTSAFRVPVTNNLFVVVAVIAAQELHIAAMHLPVISDILEVAPIHVGDWLTVVAFALSLIVAVEAYKWLRPLRDNRKMEGGEDRVA
jgi:magnesium-transporting ATPase (P-type)